MTQAHPALTAGGHRPSPDTLRALRARLEQEDPDGGGIDLSLEADVLHALFGSTVAAWPRMTRSLSFNPTVSIDDAVELVGLLLPGWSWAVTGPGPGRTTSISPGGPLRPHPIVSRGRRSPAANLLSLVLEVVARMVEAGGV